MSNTVGVMKVAVHGGLIALGFFASVADARTNAALPDMTEVLRAQHVESASVALIRGGQIVSTQAWGMAGPNRKATDATPYNLASLTKPLTAEVILRLVSAGKLSLDEPMDRYWSDPDLSRDPRRMKLTVRDINMRRAMPSTAPGNRSRRWPGAGCSLRLTCAPRAMFRRRARRRRSPCLMTTQASRCRSSG